MKIKGGIPMTSIFEPLFDTYGDSVMREHGAFD